MINNAEEIKIEYCNHRGEIAWRRVVPDRIRYGGSEWHKEDQWILEAFDCDKGLTRSFAIKSILRWCFPST